MEDMHRFDANIMSFVCVCERERSVCIYVHVNAQVFVSVLTLVYTCRGQRLMFMLLMAVKSRKEAGMQFVITSTRKVH